MKRAEFIILFALLLGLTTYTVAAQDTAKGYVKIGTQVWTTKNLDVITFRNGDTIPEAKSFKDWDKAGNDRKPVWCYYNFEPKNGKKYGKLYNWYAVHDSRGLAPQGWHIPTDKEWTILTNYLGGDTVAGKKMKSAKEWNGNNSSGFNALPAGTSNSVASSGLGTDANFWSATERTTAWSDNDVAWGRTIYSSKAECGLFSASNTIGMSVRCIKD